MRLHYEKSDAFIVGGFIPHGLEINLKESEGKNSFSHRCLKWSPICVQLVPLLSHVWLFGTQWTAARQASLFVANSQSLLKVKSIKLVMPSNHLILCHSLLLPSIFPSVRIFSSDSVLRIRWPKYWSFSFSISPCNEYSGFISFRNDRIFRTDFL